LLLHGRFWLTLNKPIAVFFLPMLDMFVKLPRIVFTTCFDLVTDSPFARLTEEEHVAPPSAAAKGVVP
jgi:hypothetical protein